jgi:hypothetical protein
MLFITGFVGVRKELFGWEGFLRSIVNISAIGFFLRPVGKKIAVFVLAVSRMFFG